MLNEGHLFVAPSAVKAAKLINEAVYYGDITAADLAGATLYGIVEREGWELLACVMVAVEGAQGYLDYMCVRGDRRDQGLGVELLAHVREALMRRGVRVVHTCISGENAAATKLLHKHGAKFGFPYVNGVIRLEEQHG